MLHVSSGTSDSKVPRSPFATIFAALQHFESLDYCVTSACDALNIISRLRHKNLVLCGFIHLSRRDRPVISSG